MNFVDSNRIAFAFIIRVAVRLARPVRLLLIELSLRSCGRELERLYDFRDDVERLAEIERREQARLYSRRQKILQGEL